MATFVISKRLNSDSYKYELMSRKGKTIFTSTNFELRFECEEEILALQSQFDKIVFMRFRSGNGKFFFKVILNDKQVAASRKYSTERLLQRGIDEVEKYMLEAEVLDFSKENDIFGD